MQNTKLELRYLKLPSHMQNVSCILYCASFKRKEECPPPCTAWNQLSVALLLLSPQPFAFFLFYYLLAVHGHVLVFMCPPLCCLHVSVALRLSLSLSFCITRRCTLCSFAQACAAEERARVRLCAKKCSSLRKSASERASEPIGWRSTARYTCTCIGRERTENREEAKTGGPVGSSIACIYEKCIAVGTPAVPRG